MKPICIHFYLSRNNWRYIYIVGCLQLTLNRNYDDVLDEIETDVIAETLANSKNISDYIRHKCIEDKDSLSRKERANMFMQYVLAHEEVLQSFWRIFLERSEFESEMVLCSECSGDLAKGTLYEKQLF